MADGVVNLLSAQVKVDASSRLVVKIGTSTASSGAASTGVAGTFPTRLGKVNASNELAVRFA
jgi:hypothetical protein